MHYVKHFNINGVDTKQVACIELNGKPNAATEGSVGLLAIDISSPMHDVYKCIGVEGSIYHWELLSSGTCIMSSIITGAGEELAEFPYDKLRTVANYVVKNGDVIIDKEGFLYQVESVGYDYCIARYNGTQIVSGMPKVGEVDNGKILSVVDGCHAFVDVEDSSVAGYVDPKFDKVNRDIAQNASDISKYAPFVVIHPATGETYEVEMGKKYKLILPPVDGGYALTLNADISWYYATAVNVKGTVNRTYTSKHIEFVFTDCTLHQDNSTVTSKDYAKVTFQVNGKEDTFKIMASYTDVGVNTKVSNYIVTVSNVEEVLAPNPSIYAAQGYFEY